MEDKVEDRRPRLEKYKIQLTLLLGTVCLICIFVFLLLIPLVLEPVVSTLYHQFVEQPVHCKVTDYNLGVGRPNCSWASCREGCTNKVYSCHQIRVIYSKETYLEDTSLEDVHSWVDLFELQHKADPSFSNVSEIKDIKKDVPLLINLKGCVYPPSVRCHDFSENL